MRLLVWLDGRRAGLIAWWRTRRAFRRHRLSPAAQQRLDAVRRRTP